MKTYISQTQIDISINTGKPVAVHNEYFETEKCQLDVSRSKSALLEFSSIDEAEKHCKALGIDMKICTHCDNIMHKSG